MTKYALSDISMVRVTENDAQLENTIPLLGIEQGRSHDTYLPHEPQHMAHIAENFRYALRMGHVEIWRLDTPVAGAGALFLSPLKKEGRQGIQVDDIVVLPEFRRRGLGSAMMRFAAALAQSRGYDFTSWECEEGKYSQHMYRSVGACPRENVKPFRLTRDIILQAIAKENPISPAALSHASCTVSNRFSLFRTVNYGIEGYDMDPTQRSLGLQIEDVAFDSVENGRTILIDTLKKYRTAKAIDFADIVISSDSPKHLELIQSFDAEQNTYSGNPSYLWELSGKNFAEAASIGRQIKGLETDSSYSSSQLNARTSSMVG